MVCLAPGIVHVGQALEKRVRAALEKLVAEEEEEYVADYLKEALSRLG